MSIKNKGGGEKKKSEIFGTKIRQKKAQTASASPMAHAETTMGSAWKESA